MKTFLSYLVPKIRLNDPISRQGVKAHIIPFLCVVAVMMIFYYGSRVIAPGWATYILSSVACLFLGVTALARVNDIAVTQTELRWQLRRLGLILVGAASMGLLLSPFLSLLSDNHAVEADWPSWREVMMRVGFAFVWLTTPGMPPWQYYISGEYKKVKVTVPNNAVVEIERLPKGDEHEPAITLVDPNTPVG